MPCAECSDDDDDGRRTGRRQKNQDKRGILGRLKGLLHFARRKQPAAEVEKQATSDDCSMDQIVERTVEPKCASTREKEIDEREERRLLFKRDQQAMSNGAYPFHARFAAEYQLKWLLGQGSFGFVYLAEHVCVRTSSKSVCAVKFILKDRVANWIKNDRLGVVPSEVNMLSVLAVCLNPNCRAIRLLDYLCDHRYCYMITEHWGVPWSSRSCTLLAERRLLGYKGGWRSEPSPGDLFECIESHTFLPTPIILQIFHQILACVVHLHDVHQIVHRDLKDENVVVGADYSIKLIDFGSAVSLRSAEDLAKQFHGTLAFAAPEIIRCRSGTISNSSSSNFKGSYDPLAAEVWSLGILLYTMAMRRAPFSDPWSIMHAEPVLPMDDPSGPPGMFDLIKKLLQKDPLKRISLNAILQHPWVSNHQTGGNAAARAHHR